MFISSENILNIGESVATLTTSSSIYLHAYHIIQFFFVGWDLYCCRWIWTDMFTVYCVRFSQNRAMWCSCWYTFCITECIERDILGCLEISYLSMLRQRDKFHLQMYGWCDWPKAQALSWQWNGVGDILLQWSQKERNKKLEKEWKGHKDKLPTWTNLD